MTPFDFLNAINDNKKDLFDGDPLAHKDYAHGTGVFWIL